MIFELHTLLLFLFNLFHLIIYKHSPRQWIKESLVNFISEVKSLSNQDILIMVICTNKVVQWTETMLSKLATFCYLWLLIKSVTIKFTCFAMFSSESLDTVTLVVVHHIHTGTIVAAWYTEAIIYVYWKKKQNNRCCVYLFPFSNRMKQNPFGMSHAVKTLAMPHTRACK